MFAYRSLVLCVLLLLLSWIVNVKRRKKEKKKSRIPYTVYQKAEVTEKYDSVHDQHNPLTQYQHSLIYFGFGFGFSFGFDFGFVYVVFVYPLYYRFMDRTV